MYSVDGCSASLGEICVIFESSMCELYLSFCSRAQLAFMVRHWVVALCGEALLKVVSSLVDFFVREVHHSVIFDELSM
jgi:hypothetical protein